MFDKDKMHQFIASASTEVVEKMFHTTIQAVSEDLMFPYDIMVIIGFEGKFNGTFWIIIPRDLSYLLSSKFLGMEQDDLDDELVHDTVKEIINMVCGNVIYMFDKQTKFNITIPSIFVDTNVQSQVHSIPPNTYNFSFQVEGQPLKMLLNLEKK